MREDEKNVVFRQELNRGKLVSRAKASLEQRVLLTDGIWEGKSLDMDDHC
jgi:hypothetical protein